MRCHLRFNRSSAGIVSALFAVGLAMEARATIHYPLDPNYAAAIRAAIQRIRTQSNCANDKRLAKMIDQLDSQLSIEVSFTKPAVAGDDTAVPLRPTASMALGIGSSTMIHWDPLVSKPFDDYPPGTVPTCIEATVEADLAHELVHAWQFMKGINKTYKPPLDSKKQQVWPHLDPTEPYAVELENVYRRGAGMCLRTYYSESLLPSYVYPACPCAAAQMCVGSYVNPTGWSDDPNSMAPFNCATALVGPADCYEGTPYNMCIDEETCVYATLPGTTRIGGSYCSCACGESRCAVNTILKSTRQCVPVATDKTNCGGCGHVCASGEICRRANCVALGYPPGGI